jgi:hypothetical protein
VADAGGGGAHENLVILRVIDIDLLDREWLIGAMEYGGFHFDVATFRNDCCILTNATFDPALANGRCRLRAAKISPPWILDS